VEEEKLTEENKENDHDLRPDNREKLALTIAEQERELAALRKSEGDLREKLDILSRSLAEAVTGYKNRVIQLHPEITEEMIAGDTIGTIDQSLEKAIGLVSRLKKSVENERAHNRVPAGAPGRRTADFSALSAREKIQYALGGKK
jgi:hypothetical protein